MNATRYNIIALSVALFLAGFAGACSEDKSDTTTNANCPNPGQSVEVEGDAYCVFIEEGFLVEQCPSDFPNGQELDGVVVCAQTEDIPEESVRSELEKQGLLEEDAQSECTQDSECSGGQVCTESQCVDDTTPECTEATDCPQPSVSSRCDGNSLVMIFAAAACVEGMCQINGSETRSDCDPGLVCQDGACIEDNTDTCTDASDCPQIEPFFGCEDTVAVNSSATSACVEGMCEVTMDSTNIDCSETGLVCQDGACIENGPECTESDDCPQPSVYIECEAGIAVQILANGFCNEQGMCQINGDETRQDCVAEGMVCEFGDCVAPGDVVVEAGQPLEVPDGHRGCTTVADCTAVYTGCGACEGDCQGVTSSLQESYSSALSCEDYDGPECDFDCHPDFNLTELVCDEGLCKVNTL